MSGRTIHTVVRVLAVVAITGALLVTGMNTTVPAPSVQSRPGSLARPETRSEGATPRTSRFSIDAQVNADGSLTVTETIVEDMGTTRRHGIERIIPVIETTVDDTTRMFEISDVRVATSQGTPGDVEAFTGPTELTVRIGNPDRTITGVHAYQLTYTLDALVTETAGALELSWDPISSWSEPIDRLDARIASPAPVRDARCITGASGSNDPCTSISTDGTQVVVSQRGVRPGQPITTHLQWDTGAFGPVSPPASPPGLTARLGGTPTAAAVFVALVMLALAELAVRRKTHQMLAVTPAMLDATFALSGTPTESRPSSPDGLARTDPPGLHAVGDEPAVEFVPPQHFSPAALGRLLDTGSASERLTATAIDLGARGYFDITDTEAAGLLGTGRDWRLDWRGGAAHTALHPYEQDVLDTLFAGQAAVVLSSRRAAMPSLAQRHDRAVRELLRARGLMSRRVPGPGVIHWLATGLTTGALVLVAGALTLGALTLGTTAPTSVPLLVVGAVVLGLVSVLVPFTSLTPLGAAMRWRARGFQRLFDESESHHAELAANAGILRQYMGYAVCLGSVERWTAAFSDEVVARSAPSFSPLSVAAFGTSFSSAAVHSSSSTGGAGIGGGSFGGGGSGGGGGGGGGGSW